MDNSEIFNLLVCILGITIFFIHILDLIIKKNKRKDEVNLLIFFIFTAVHFSLYLIFIFLKHFYPSDSLIIGGYTTFYIMNNLELLLLFFYTISYIPISKKVKKNVEITNITIFTIFIILDIINIFTHMFFGSRGGKYYRTDWMIISQIYQFISFIMVYILTFFNKKLSLTNKIAFSTYCVLPLLGIVLQIIFKGYAVGYLSIVISIEVLFLFVNVKKNNDLIAEEKRNKEMEVKIMMSQIQPHFIYNTLASISTLIKIDPDQAQKGLDQFTEYLRTNLSSINENNLIPFHDELSHIVTYLSLEKMRFNERIKVIYDIKVKDFLLPPLTVQPIVENAVKHGILKRIEGGTVEIKTYETNEHYIIEVNDDGVGFDINNITNFDTSHIGINNAKTRISSLCEGDIEINSEINKGTRVKIILNK